MANGFDAYTADIEGLIKRMPDMVDRVVAKAALDTEAHAKVLVPVDTGNLKNSIGSTIEGPHAEVGPTASYGEYVELGTSHTRAQPYMGPAVDTVAPQMVRALEILAEEGM